MTTKSARRPTTAPRPPSAQGRDGRCPRLTAPYNFVPLNRSVHLLGECEAKTISHDVPFKNGICGSFRIRITAMTPLMCGAGKAGGGQRVKGRDRPDEAMVKERFTLGGRPAIPGAALKGMLRNVLEIASFGKIGPRMDDRHFALRDLQNPKDYVSHLSADYGPKSRGGWLSMNPSDGSWSVQPCQQSLVLQTELESIVRIDLGSRQPAEDKYKNWREDRLDVFAAYGPVTREGDQLFAKGRMVSRASGVSLAPVEGKEAGRVVFTGQPQNRREKDTKKTEFIFHHPEGRRIDVGDAVREAFEAAHRDPNDGKPNREWLYWRGRLRSGKPIPVFWLPAEESEDRIGAMGLASMFRLPYRHGTHAMAAHATAEHLDGNCPDLAEAIFGYVSANLDRTPRSLKGRVDISHAIATANVRDHDQEVELPLVSPKPQFYPAYVEQPFVEPSSRPPRVPTGQYFHDGKDRPHAHYQTYMDDEAVLAGWKRYPVTSGTRSRPDLQRQVGGKAASRKVLTRFRPVAAGSVFEATAHVHNLRPHELGAVLWCLRWGGQGGRDGLWHSLGMARPYGYGAVAVEILPDGCDLDRNDGGEAIPFDAALRLADEFEAHMNGIVTTWSRSREVQTLLAMANPKEGDRRAADGGLDFVVDPQAFQKAKNKDCGLILEPYLGVDSSTMRRCPAAHQTPVAPSSARSGQTAASSSGARLPREVRWEGERVKVLRRDGDFIIVDEGDGEEVKLHVSEVEFS